MPSGTTFCRSAPADGYLRHAGGSSGASQKHRTPARTRKTAATTGGPVSGTGAPVLAAARERLQAAGPTAGVGEESAAKAEAASLARAELDKRSADSGRGARGRPRQL